MAEGTAYAKALWQEEEGIRDWRSSVELELREEEGEICW